MDSKPDTIKISVSKREEVHSNKVDLFVVVKGASAFAGNESLRKAREVTQLIEKLTHLGITDEDVSLQGAFIDSKGGTLLASSNAAYRLKIHCNKLDLIPGVLEIIGKQKDATLERIAWKYSEESARQRILEEAITSAKTKAEKTAASLGVKLLGIYDFIETVSDDESPLPYLQAIPAPRVASGVTPPQPSLGIDIQHSKFFQVNVDIWYRVSSL